MKNTAYRFYWESEEKKPEELMVIIIATDIGKALIKFTAHYPNHSLDYIRNIETMQEEVVIA